MSLSLSAADLARCEALSRTLLSPLSASSVDEWRQAVNQDVRELFRSERTIFLLSQEAEPYYSDDEGGVMLPGLLSYLEAFTHDGPRFRDPVINLWYGLRHQRHVDVFDWSVNAHMIAEHGFAMDDSPLVMEVLLGTGARDFLGLYALRPETEAMLWLLYDRPGAEPLGPATLMLLRALQPAFQAGLGVLANLHAHRTALDLLDEPLVVFSVDGRELFRNAAVTRLLEPDPDREHVLAELHRLARHLRPLYAAPAPAREAVPCPSAQHTLATASGRYTLRGSLLPPGGFHTDPCLLITIMADRAPTLPDAADLRARYGLTRREAEVALLLAEGLSNDQLAERLFISPHTARRHTEQVLAKLELNSRKALALKLLQG